MTDLPFFLQIKGLTSLNFKQIQVVASSSGGLK
jgi:hypothetical protein